MMISGDNFLFILIKIDMGPVCDNVKHNDLGKIEEIYTVPSKAHFQEVSPEDNRLFQQKVDDISASPNN